jgi:glucose/arabinose dehydrogenase
MRRALRLLLVFAAVAAVMASRPGHGAASASLERKDALDAPAVILQPLATGLDSVTAITNAGDGRLFVTLQFGKIVIWDGTQILPTPFLDVSTIISAGGERGLLSTAFHPGYATNGFFFINYTDITSGATVIARYHVSAFDRNQADAFSGQVLLTIAQPYANHNGGQLQFGPDGYLYVGMGDGGSANDPQCNAQSSASLLGKMLRIDVNQNVNQAPYYGIPADNPYVHTTGPAEAWAFGMRNPWRFSFDRLTGDLYIGDVGQDAREEVDFQPASSAGGQNYGWKIMEGSLCGTQGNAGCTFPTAVCGDPSYTLPVIEYTHDNGACAVTGGYVYRGQSIAGLYGNYVFGDYCSGVIYAAIQQSGSWSAVVLPIQVSSLSTFGEDSSGELYVGTASGSLYLIATAGAVSPTIDSIEPSSGLTRGGEPVVITGTNFSGQTQVLFGAVPGTVTIQSATHLVVVSPPHIPGNVDIRVVNPGAPSAVRTQAFAYVAISRVPLVPAPRVVERP